MNTNSRVERFNLLVKGLMLGSKYRKNKRPNLAVAVDRMLTGLQNAFEERRTVALFREMKRPIVNVPDASGILGLLAEVLSVAGFKLLMKHLRQHPTDRVVIEGCNGTTYSLRDRQNGKEYALCILEGTCSCTWQMTYGLPCNHALMVLQDDGMNKEQLMLFIDALFLQRTSSSVEQMILPMADDVTSDDEQQSNQHVEKQKETHKKVHSKPAEIFADTRPLLNDILNAISNHQLPQVREYQKFLRQLTTLIRNGLVPKHVALLDKQHLEKLGVIGKMASSATF
jgi:hypothetical protein